MSSIFDTTNEEIRKLQAELAEIKGLITPPPSQEDVARSQLSEQELYVCQHAGMSPAQYLAQKVKAQQERDEFNAKVSRGLADYLQRTGQQNEG